MKNRNISIERSEMTGHRTENGTALPHQILGEPLKLTCGALLKNRIAKAAMSDSLGNGAGDPTEAQARLYERWAEGGAALSIIGEVQGDRVSRRNPETWFSEGKAISGPWRTW